MKKILAFLCCALASMTTMLYAADNYQNNHVIWLTNYEEAVNQSKASSKPIVLFFTGSDWCGWCTKLEQESLDTPEFAKNAGSKFIFVKLDFPLNSTLPAHTASQNKDLQKRFNIKGFPTLVILESENQRQIGTTGYRAGGGKLYADHLLKIVNDFNQYNQKMKTAEMQKLTAADVKELYNTASSCGYDWDLKTLVKEGEAKEASSFFMMKRYKQLADDGLIEEKEARELKIKLMNLDPNNEQFLHYQLAVIDFESLSDIEKDKKTVEQSIASLTNYIERFGTQDKDHTWHLEMLISQSYFEKNNLNEALKFAKRAYFSAPPSAKNDISLAIKNIQAQSSLYETAMNK